MHNCSAALMIVHSRSRSRPHSSCYALRLATRGGWRDADVAAHQRAPRIEGQHCSRPCCVHQRADQRDQQLKNTDSALLTTTPNTGLQCRRRNSNKSHYPTQSPSHSRSARADLAIFFPPSSIPAIRVICSCTSTTSST